MPEVRMVCLSGTGHHLFAERMAAFFTTVESFLADRPLPFPIETRITAHRTIKARPDQQDRIVLTKSNTMAIASVVPRRHTVTLVRKTLPD